MSDSRERVRGNMRSACGTCISKTAILVALGLLVLLGSYIYLLPEHSFWCMDDANRFLQVHSLSSNPALPPALPYPGSDLITDSDMISALKPLPAHFGSLVEGSLYSQYNPLLALLSAPSYALLGQRGIYVPVLIAGILLALLTACMMRNSDLGMPVRLLLVFFCTSIPFFSLTFFSHTIALLLALCGLLLIRDGRLVLGFLLASLALVFREEMVISYPLMLLFLERKPLSYMKLMLATVVAVSAFLVVQKVVTGHWLGTHVGASGWQQDVYSSGMTWIEARFYIARRAFINAYPGFGPTGLILGLLLWVAWSASRVLRGVRAKIITLVGLGLCCVPNVAILLRGSISLDVMDVQNPLVIFPILWVIPPPRRFMVASGIIVLVMILLMSPMHTEDMAWGFRHVLLMLFILILFTAKKIPRSIIIAVMAVGVLSTVTSLSVLTAKRTRSDYIVQLLRENGHAVITTSWEQPQELASLIVEGIPVFNATSTHDLYIALRYLEDLQPQVIARRGSSDLVFSTAEAAGMNCELIGTGFASDPLTSALVFRCTPPAD